MRLYLDACCLNRLTDDQSQVRIRNEAEAVEAIFRLVREGKATWVSSTALEIEISRNRGDRRHDVAALLALANEVVVPQSRSVERATFLQTLGFDPFDLVSGGSAMIPLESMSDEHFERHAWRFCSANWGWTV